MNFIIRKTNEYMDVFRENIVLNAICVLLLCVIAPSYRALGCRTLWPWQSCGSTGFLVSPGD